MRQIVATVDIEKIDIAQQAPPKTSPRSLPAALIATGAAGGSIAAVRLLGSSGIKVGVLSSEPLTAAAWSNRASQTYSAPSEKDTERFLERLLEIGAADPGQVLLSTSDETAWMYTANAKLLGQYFRMNQPSVDSMRSILDKKLFSDAAVRAGLAVLPTWEPRTFDDVVDLAPTLPYPILIKPRTHVHRLRNDKGMVAKSKAELIEFYRKYVAREEFVDGQDSLPDASLPILQQFVNITEEGVHSVSGFIDRSGELFVTRQATKVFQRSKPAGVGICFQSLPTDHALADSVARLCHELDYFGIFEVEFIRFDGRWSAIDFNPRLFNQVGMDIHRGMPLPLLAYLDASGERAELRKAVNKARAEDINIPAVFCDGFTMRAILSAKTLTGRISLKERSYWRSWTKQHAQHAVDFAEDKYDRKPGIIHALSEIYLGVKAFPRFLESTPRTAPSAEADLAKVQS
jgi:D-aspartate ligase